MLLDNDFHPDEPTVRVFRSEPEGVLLFDEDVLVTESLHEDGVVLRHYAFADLWHKINVTTDLSGKLLETGDDGNRFAFNCDIATPMERDGNNIFAVDLFVDVLVRQDATTYVVGDEDELAEMIAAGLVSPSEGQASRRALAELVATIESGELLDWLESLVAFGPCGPPLALEMTREPIPERMLMHHRTTW